MTSSQVGDNRANYRNEVFAGNPKLHSAGSLEAQFASFATTIQQRIDSDSGGGQVLSGSLSAQVERAVSQAMRRGNIASAGGGAGTAYGGSSGNGYGGSTGNTYGGGYGVMAGNPGVAQPAMAAGPQAITAVQLLPVELPPPQAVLASEAVIAQNDLLAALDALQPMSVLSDPGDIAAYKDIIRAEVVALTAEFARADLPRPARVKVLVGALLGWAFPADQAQKVPPPVTAGTQTGD